MYCTQCKREMERGTVERYPFPASGLDLILIDWPVWKCVCGDTVPEIPHPERFKNYLTRQLILSTEPLDGDAILFLRKRMGKTGVKLAEILGVSRVEVSRWENDSNDISPYMDFKLRIEAIERLVPEDYQTVMKLEVVKVMHSLYQPEPAADPSPLEVPPALAATFAPAELAFGR